MKVGWSDGQLEEKHEQREKKQNQSEVERWNSGNQLRNRLGKERVSHTHRAVEYVCSWFASLSATNLHENEKEI